MHLLDCILFLIDAVEAKFLGVVQHSPVRQIIKLVLWGSGKQESLQQNELWVTYAGADGPLFKRMTEQTGHSGGPKPTLARCMASFFQNDSGRSSAVFEQLRGLFLHEVFSNCMPLQFLRDVRARDLFRLIAPLMVLVEPGHFSYTGSQISDSVDCQPQNRLSVKDISGILRDHKENIPLDSWGGPQLQVITWRLPYDTWRGLCMIPLIHGAAYESRGRFSLR